jgi:rubrerythrin
MAFSPLEIGGKRLTVHFINVRVMASEPTEEGAVRVDLSPELDEWLRERAATLGVDPETVLVQLLSSHRATADLGGADVDGLAIEVSGSDAIEDVVDPAVKAAVADAIGADAVDGGATVDEALAEGLDERLSRLVAEEVEAALAERDAVEESAVEDQVEAAVGERLDAVESDVDERLRSIRENFREKLDDVRQRVIQVKQEADAKADADHDHEAFARLDAIGGRLADVEEDVDRLEATLENVQSELEAVAEGDDERLEEVTEELDDLDERLTTVAWVVSDLREAYESKTGEAALEDIKRQAGAADVSRAKCENCGEGVEIGLLTEPACPHCEATVTRLDPSSGFFSSPTLLVASQLESGEE